MPFRCVALGVGACPRLLWRPRLGSENPVAVIVLYLAIPEYSEDSFFSSYPSFSFVHTPPYRILSVSQISHVHIVSINPQGTLLGIPTFTLMYMNTRMHNCFPAKQDL
ncbi:hypothetical protein CgunFtcFv8_006395 [Champsocephalus gunnari]|uniref:Uncharacterized protein n=1 Tax=Champsocephalus gunnari TaxID=52237 RepID=A0AAN8GZ93_CHAGU|nr:hypothetical protein CgunFtcFv8_006395 [Champsocephalus gunnari]